MTCCTIPTQHTLIHPLPVPMDPSAGELVPSVRAPHRAWPGCDARELPPSRRHEATGNGYPWCLGRAAWTWNEQHLCDEHGDMFRRGVALAGIYPDGRWCRRYRDPECPVHGEAEPDGQ